MALSHSPSTILNGLVLCLDAANTKGYDKYENLLTYSEDFSNAIWNKQNGFSITPNTAIAPDGTLTADTASRSNTASQFLFQAYGAAGTFTLSCWVRTITGTSTFYMFTYNGIDGTLGLVERTATTTWQRFSTTATVTTASNWYPCIPTTSNTQFYIWGAQLEKGSSVNDYYATTVSVKNRGTIWTDLSGNGNNGTLTNGPTYSVDNAGSIVFDGSNDYVELNTNNIITGTNPFTFEAFYRVTNTSVAAELFGNYGAGYTSNTIWISGRYGVYINGLVPYFQGYPLGAGTYHMAFTRTSAGACVLYKNGVIDGTATSTTSISVGQNFRIGSDVNGIAEVFGGNLYSLKVYNRALIASEIQQNFNALRGRFGL